MSPETGPRLRIEVLGAVRAWRGAQELVLGQPRQQAVLAVLAVLANRTVSRDQLVDAVWGGNAPATAANSLHTYVARLRRVLEPGRTRRAAGEVLTGSRSGYLLRLEPGQLDLEVFRERLVRAGDLANAGDTPTSAAVLADALRLWRGAPFAGVPGPFADAERSRAGELRLSALEDLAAAKLRLGQHTEVAADLAALIQEHPFRERLRALDMIALYRCGRQADALRTYTEGRRLLVDELGIEPGPDLQRLYHDILVSDPRLAGSNVMGVAGSLVSVSTAVSTAGDEVSTPPVPAAPDIGVGHRLVERLVERRPVRAMLSAITVVATAGVLAYSGLPVPPQRPTTRAVAQNRPAESGSGSSLAAPLLPGDADRFIADVTIPDGTTVGVGQRFTKIWEIQNTGTVDWHNRYLQRVGLVNGPGLCTSPERVPIPDTKAGDHVRITVDFVAPTLAGSCRVDWKMVDAQGHVSFPSRPGLYIIVSVTDQVPSSPPAR